MIQQTAMLAALELRSFGGQRTDRDVTAEVHSSHNASDGAGRYVASLIPKKFLDPIQKNRSAAYALHKRLTMAWGDHGFGLLPVVLLDKHRNAMQAAKDKDDALIRDLIRDYPLAKAEAKIIRNGMYHEEDYPSEAELQASFRFRCKYMPVPDGGAIPEMIHDSYRHDLERELNERIAEEFDNAHHDLIGRVKESVGRLSTSLREFDERAGKRKLHESMLSNLQEMIELGRAMNLKKDQALEIALNQAESIFAYQGLDKDTLRDDPVIRADVRRVSDATLDALSKIL